VCLDFGAVTAAFVMGVAVSVIYKSQKNVMVSYKSQLLFLASLILFLSSQMYVSFLLVTYCNKAVVCMHM